MLTTNAKLIVLYYSRHGSTKLLANHIARGIESVSGCEAILRTVADIQTVQEGNTPSDAKIASHLDVTITLDELSQCDGLAVGSPVWFGNMAAPMKHFWDQTSSLWVRGDLIDKPACVFTSSSSPHGGQETTLQSMLLPLFHHGMLVMGIPYSEPNLHTSVDGGTPYGSSSISTQKLDSQVAQLAFNQGKRLAQLALTLKSEY